jgi:hypothetical protein
MNDVGDFHRAAAVASAASIGGYFSSDTRYVRLVP